MLLAKLLPFVAVSLLAVACAPTYTEGTSQDSDSTDGTSPKKNDGDSDTPATTTATPAPTTTIDAGTTTALCKGTEMVCLDFAKSPTLTPFTQAGTGTCAVANGALKCSDAMISTTPPKVATSYDFNVDFFPDVPASGSSVSVTMAMMSLNLDNQNAGFWVSFDLDVSTNGTATIFARGSQWGVPNAGQSEEPLANLTLAAWHHVTFHIAANTDGTVTATAAIDGDAGFNQTLAWAWDAAQVAFEVGADPLQTNTGAYDVQVKNITLN